jgi:hypothetical protein
MEMVVDVGVVKNHIKPKADSTLLNMRKADLIEYIRCLENNYNVAVSFNENQAKYIESLDVSPVVHGHWFSLTDCSNAGVYCSVCHKKVWKEDYAWCNRKNKLRSNYCPNCGAKMDGGSDDA